MFRHYTSEQVIELLKTFKFTRPVNQWHIHNTAIPSYKDFTGSNHDILQQGMKDYHINVKGWVDYGVHFTLFPDGVWLSGRDLNMDPASILGWNTGALAVEMLGYFNVGKDKMTAQQKEAIIKVTHFIVYHMNLTPHFHRDNTSAGNKECPGTAIDREQFFKEVKDYMDTPSVGPKPDIRFTDMIVNGKEHWANKAANLLSDKKILKGISNGDNTFRFEPDRPSTRAEVAVMLANLYESIKEELKKK